MGSCPFLLQLPTLVLLQLNDAQLHRLVQPQMRRSALSGALPCVDSRSCLASGSGLMSGLTDSSVQAPALAASLHTTIAPLVLHRWLPCDVGAWARLPLHQCG
jgi:hypothetical protein